MASFYERKGSPYYWICVKQPDGSFKRSSSGIRIKSTGSTQKITLRVAQERVKEATYCNQVGDRAFFSAWVPRWIASRYENENTRTRYFNAWAPLSAYLAYRKISYPVEVNYSVCVDYMAFRTNPPVETIQARKWNTALTELRVFSAILQEAVRRELILYNPCVKLGLKRRDTKAKKEITIEEQILIEEKLQSAAQWMRDSWIVGMRQGCRLAEVEVPLEQIDARAKTIAFTVKGGGIHCAPLHPDVEQIYHRAVCAGQTTLVELPKAPAKKWWNFFREIGLEHSFHSIRVTVVTRLARNGFNQSDCMAYVGHASETVHAIYRKLSPADVRGLGSALDGLSA
jgi:site-specific recombinase XerD